ncbi:MAG TPA: DinB family protein [Sphingobacteriaceae bacterium]
MKTKNSVLRKAILVVLVMGMSVGPLLAAGPGEKAAEWKRAKEYTKEYLDAMPESGINYKPTPEVRSFAEQMLHIANANYLFAATASGKTNPNQGKDLEKMDDLKSREALTKAVMDSYDFVINSLQDVEEGKMKEKVSIFKMEMDRGTAYEKAFEHQTHHRGQTTVYLRLKGVKPPQEKLF